MCKLIQNSSISQRLLWWVLVSTPIFALACGDDDDDNGDADREVLDGGSWSEPGGGGFAGKSSAGKPTSYPTAGKGGTTAGKPGSPNGFGSGGTGGGTNTSTNTPDAGKKETVPPEDSGVDEMCIVDKETVLYLSADDSNSVASPVIVRKAIQTGQSIPASSIRTYEFTNYYDFQYQAPESGMLTVVPQMRREHAGDNGAYVLQIGVQSPHQSLEDAKQLALTFVVDSSGSMGGRPLELEKATLRAIAANLRENDVVSMTSWNTETSVLIDSHAVTGPNDQTFLNAIARLNAGGSTDLNKGLEIGYQLAKKNFYKSKLNRVILISDGQANVGTTDEQLIAQNADDSEGDAIYLIGVGCGVGFNDTLMDTVTDAGKGAYLFIDTEEEARKQFSGDRFLSNLAIAAMNVRVKLTLPPTFSMKKFHGEQFSGNPAKVEPQHLAPNDAMVFHQTVKSCAPDRLSGEEYVTAEATFTDPDTRDQKSAVSQATINQLIAEAHPQLLKGDAVVEYAEMFKVLPSLSDNQARKEKCESVQSLVRYANQERNDPDLNEIDSLLTTYCARF